MNKIDRTGITIYTLLIVALCTAALASHLAMWEVILLAIALFMLIYPLFESAFILQELNEDYRDEIERERR